VSKPVPGQVPSELCRIGGILDGGRRVLSERCIGFSFQCGLSYILTLVSFILYLILLFIFIGLE
jgi:hypothetical protein